MNQIFDMETHIYELSGWYSLLLYHLTMLCFAVDEKEVLEQRLTPAQLWERIKDKLSLSKEEQCVIAEAIGDRAEFIHVFYDKMMNRTAWKGCCIQLDDFSVSKRSNALFYQGLNLQYSESYTRLLQKPQKAVKVLRQHLRTDDVDEAAFTERCYGHLGGHCGLLEFNIVMLLDKYFSSNRDEWQSKALPNKWEYFVAAIQQHNRYEDIDINSTIILQGINARDHIIHLPVSDSEFLYYRWYCPVGIYEEAAADVLHKVQTNYQQVEEALEYLGGLLCLLIERDDDGTSWTFEDINGFEEAIKKAQTNLKQMKGPFLLVSPSLFRKIIRFLKESPKEAGARGWSLTAEAYK